MALTGGARVHDPNMGAKAEVVHCSLALKLGAGMRPHPGLRWWPTHTGAPLRNI